MIENYPKWNALYLKSRFEKKVAETFISKKIPFFLPLIKVRKKYSDRYKIVEEPLLKSYIFVPENVFDNTFLLQTAGVVRLVRSNGKVASIHKEELFKIGNILQEHIFNPEDLSNLSIGQEILIKEGVLKNKIGKIEAISKNKIKLEIKELGFYWEINI